MNPSADQVKSALRSFLAAFGGGIAGYAAGRGWMSQEQAIAIMNNDQFMGVTVSVILFLIGAASSGGSMIRSIMNRTPEKMAEAISAMPAEKMAVALAAMPAENMVSAVAAMPEVARVETTRTEEGRALAQSVPNPIVVVTS